MSIKLSGSLSVNYPISYSYQ